MKYENIEDMQVCSISLLLLAILWCAGSNDDKAEVLF
jgi:hypothetical protein